MNTKGLNLRERRKLRIRKKILGSVERPRLSVYRSNKHLYAQIIDDTNHKTLASASTLKTDGSSNCESAKALGKDIADKARQINIESVVFDRNGYQFHGIVKQLAESAREAGLKF